MATADKSPNFVINGGYTDAPYASVRAWAVVGENRREFGIVKFESSFMLNAIPTATAVLATGTRVPDTAAGRGEPQTIRPGDWSSMIKQYDPVEVYARITGAYDSDGTVWPDTDILLFSGYVKGMGTLHAWNTVGIQLEMIHWLSDLNTTSAINSYLTPLAAGHLTAPLRHVFDVYDFTDVIGLAATLFDDVENDLWGSGIKVALSRLADGASQPNHLGPGLLGLTDLYDKLEGSNTVVAAKLGGTDAFRFDNEQEVTVIPLKVREGHLGSTILRNIESIIVASMIQPEYGYTAWDQILSLAQQFLFTIIPTVKSATCVPSMRQLRGDEHVFKTIGADEYSSLQAAFPREYPKRGLVLLGVGNSYYNTFSSQDIPYGVSYFVNEALENGYVDIVEAPPWLVVSFMEAAGSTDGIIGGDNAANVPTSDTDPDEVGDPSIPPDNPKIVHNDYVGIGNAWCEALYWNQQFSMRSGQLHGKLRLDIAPGSIVKIEIPGQSFEESQGFFRASVDGVSVLLDAQSSVARTTLMVSNLRTDAEADQAADGHPLYEDAWSGTQLIRLAGIDT